MTGRSCQPTSMTIGPQSPDCTYGVSSDNSSESIVTGGDLSPPSSLSYFSDEIDSNMSDNAGFESRGDTCRSRKLPRTSRIQRNLAEKQRRDKLNRNIGRLAAMVPFVAVSPKRINKSGILRLTASYLRLHNGLLRSSNKQNDWNRLILNSEDLSNLVEEITDGFLMIVDESGKLMFVSEGIEGILGHSVIDVLGHSIYTLIHPDDHSLFDEHVKNNLMAFDWTKSIDSKNIPRTNFYCSMGENVDPKYSCCSARYKLVKIAGYLKLIQFSPPNSNNERVEKLFVATVKLGLNHPYRQFSRGTDANEILFRSTINGKVGDVDPRFSLILGYMPDDVIGRSGYNMIHPDDHSLAALAHTQMLSEGSFFNLPLRLLTFTSSSIYVNSCGKLVSSIESGELDTLYMVAIVMPPEEGEKALALVKHRYTPFIGSLDFAHLYEAIIQKSKSRIDFSCLDDELAAPTDYCAAPPKRPRGRPRKYPIAQKEPAAVTRSNGDQKIDLILPMKAITQQIDDFTRYFKTYRSVYGTRQCNAELTLLEMANNQEHLADCAQSYSLVPQSHQNSSCENVGTDFSQYNDRNDDPYTSCTYSLFQDYFIATSGQPEPEAGDYFAASTSSDSQTIKLQLGGNLTPNYSKNTVS